jgi:hypothetical protein
MKGSRGEWLNPWSVCPDAKASKVHKGKYWSNSACKNDFTRTTTYKKKRSTTNMMEKLGDILK